MIKTFNRSSYSAASLLSALCIAMVIAVLMLSDYYFDASMRFSGPKLKYSVPLVQLQRKVLSFNDHVRAIHATGSSSTSFSENQFRNQSAIRKIGKLISGEEKVERGLAVARALIRRAASSTTENNRSSTTINDVVEGDDYVPNGVVYRNPGAFYR